MFGFLRKNKQNKQDQNSSFAPQVFTSPQAFVDCFIEGESKIDIGESEGKRVSLPLSRYSNHISILDKENEVSSVVKNIICNHNFSYIIYDPLGVYEKAIRNDLRKDYDTFTLDLNDKAHLSRIDLFEIANITQRSHLIVLMIARFIKCTKEEAPIALCLLSSICNYLFEVKNKISPFDMFDVVNQIEEGGDILLKLRQSQQRNFTKFEDASEKVKRGVLKKIEQNFLKQVLQKCTNPNIFSITTTKKKTIVFVREVPLEYQFITTMFLFNFKSSSALSDTIDMTPKNDTNTIIIDTYPSKSWYDKQLLNQIVNVSSKLLDCGNAYIDVVEDREPKEANIVIYAHSTNEAIAQSICDKFILSNQLDSEKDSKLISKISKQYFNNKEIPQDILSKSPFTPQDILTSNKLFVYSMGHDLDNIAKPIMIDPIQ